MTLLESLLDAIVRLDGDSLVMHVGEKPYVVTTSSVMSALRGPLCWGQVELSSRPLTVDAVLGMLSHILPPEQRRLLDEVGAIEHEIHSSACPGHPFILTAARGGDDIWVEVRRKAQVVEAAAVEISMEATPVAVAGEPEVPAPVEEQPGRAEILAAEPEEREPDAIREVAPVAEPVAPIAEEPPIRAVHDDVHEIEVPANFEWAPGEAAPRIVAAAEGPVMERSKPEPVVELSEPVLVLTRWDPEDIELVPPAIELAEPELAVERAEPEFVVDLAEPELAVAQDEAEQVFDLAEEDEVGAIADSETVDDRTEPAIDLMEGARAIEREPVAMRPTSEPAIEIVEDGVPSFLELAPEAAATLEPPVAQPTLVQKAKPALKLQPLAAPAASTEASLVGVLKAAAARGASTVYAVADSRPMVRLDGEIAVLGIEAAVTGADVDRFTFEFAPRDQVAEPRPEWTCAVKGVGRIRCVTFRDDSGAGLIFHLPSPDVSTADELGLSPRIQALCGEADGLIVIAGPRGSGKSTMLDAFVDLINRTRNDHVITIESHIRTAHAKRHSFISQRQSSSDGDAIAAAARSALREGPDVLVIEDLRAPEALSVALDAARSGRLVFGGIAAPTASAAVERLIGAYPADRRSQMRALLAGSLRAVVAQVLVRKPNGGRIGARELLLNSPAVEKLILDGATPQLPIAIDGGRRLGMVTMNDALGALVRNGVVDVNEACRCAPDRASLIAALERDGIDVSNVERWA